MTRHSLSAVALAWALAAATPAAAQVVLYAETFDSGLAAATWTATASSAPAGNTADFAFNYSTVGIPAAPNSVGGTTVGMQLKANRPGTGVFSGVTATPNGRSFTGNYTLRFDAWQNLNGPLNGTANGSTQLTGGGIGARAGVAQFPAVVDGVFVAATGDGASSQDYRICLKSVSAVTTAANYSAASLNNTAALYTSNFGTVAAPAAQLALYPQQTGTTQAGALGMEWHTWTVTKQDNTVTWAVRNRNGVDVQIATVDVTGTAFTGDDVFFVQADTGAGSAAVADDAVLFGLIDNVVVFAPVPEPATLTLAGAAAAGLVAVRRRKAA